MIYVDRSIVNTPEVFNYDTIRRKEKRLEEFYNTPLENRRQKRISPSFDLKDKTEIRKALKNLFKGKCAYCESLINLEATLGIIEHFRPVSNARGLKKNSSEHYWWLSYEWRNLHYTCPICSRYKSNWFPIDGNRAKVLTPYEKLKEKALLIDPCNNNPEEHFIYDESGNIDFLTIEGKTTIEILKLNRQELIEARKYKLKTLTEEWENFIKLFNKEKTNRIKLKKITNNWEELFTQFSEIPYLGFQRYMLSKWIANRSDIQEYLSKRKYNEEEILKPLEGNLKIYNNIQIKEQLEEKQKKIIEEKLNIDQLKHIYIEKIEINNFKCFSNILINFNNSSTEGATYDIENKDITNEPWLLFLGENGVGKSSLLKAIAIGLSGKEYIDKLGIKGSDILKNETQSGYLRIYLVGEQKPISVDFSKTEIIASNDKPIVNLVAYNSIRLRPVKNKLTPERQIFKNVKVRNLFDFSSSLIDADAWLLGLKKQETFDRVALTLKDLMMLHENEKIEVFENQIFVKKENGKRIGINDLSDGYQSVYLLAVDIMSTLVSEMTTFDLVEGIVMIDEIGTHLHPRWRMKVVKQLRKAFPKIQFVVTTHEPLCLRGLKAGEIVVLANNQEEAVILTELPDPSELRVDQILTSDFFGLKSTIDPETESLFDEYYEILALDEENRTEAQKNSLLELSRTIPRIKHLGDTEREELTYYVIDELLACKVRKDGIKNKEKLKDEALKRVKSIWETLDS